MTGWGIQDGFSWQIPLNCSLHKIWCRSPHAERQLKKIFCPTGSSLELPLTDEKSTEPMVPVVIKQFGNCNSNIESYQKIYHWPQECMIRDREHLSVVSVKAVLYHLVFSLSRYLHVPIHVFHSDYRKLELWPTASRCSYCEVLRKSVIYECWILLMRSHHG